MLENTFIVVSSTSRKNIEGKNFNQIVCLISILDSEK